MFSQVLTLIGREHFGEAARRHGVEGVRCWHQFSAMLFCHMA